MAKSNAETVKNITKELEELLPNGYVAIVGGGKWTEKAKQQLIAKLQAMPTEKEPNKTEANAKTGGAMVMELINKNKTEEPFQMKSCCSCCNCSCHCDHIEDEDEEDYEENYGEHTHEELVEIAEKLNEENSKLAIKNEDLEVENSDLEETIEDLKKENQELEEKIEELQDRLEKIISVANDD